MAAMVRTLPTLPRDSMAKLGTTGEGRSARSLTASGPGPATSSNLRATAPLPGPAGGGDSAFVTRSQDISYDKIILLFQHPLSAAVHERHVAAIERICRANAAGVPIRDLPHVQAILLMTLEFVRAGQAAVFEDVLVTLFRTLSKPFVKRTATDEFKMLGAISAMLGAVAHALDPTLPVADRVRIEAAAMLALFASAHGHRPSALELLPDARAPVGGETAGGASSGAPALPAAAMAVSTSPDRNFYKHQELLEKSGAAGTVVACFAAAVAETATSAEATGTAPEPPAEAAAAELLPAAAEPSEEPAPEAEASAPAAPAAGHSSHAPPPLSGEPSNELPAGGGALRAALADTLLEFSCVPGNAEQLVSAGVLEPIVRVLEASTFRSALVPAVMELLWNLVEHTDLPARLGRATGRLARALARLTRSLLLEGYSMAAKELRNDILVVTGLLLVHEPNREAFRAAGLLPPALAVAVAPELPESSGLVKAFTQTKEDEDYELKLLMLGIVSQLCRGEGAEDALDQAAHGQLFHVLYLYLDASTSPEEHPALRRWTAAQAEQLQYCALMTLSQLLPVAGFPIRRHEFVELDGPRLVMEFVRRCGAHPAAARRREAALGLLRRCAALPDLQDALGEAGAVGLALDLLCGLLPAPASGGLSEPGRLHALGMLGALCRNHPPNRTRLLEDRGVAVLHDELAALRGRDATLPSAHAVAAIEAVWDAVVPARGSRARFLALGGMEALLDLLEATHPYVQPVVLGCLADLLQFPAAHPFLHEWRSRAAGTPAGPLLMSIWRREEAARGVTTDAGTLRNLARPLSGSGHRTEWKPAEETVYGFREAARRDALAGVRGAATGEVVFSKVHAVCSTLGFGAGLPGLSARDQATMCTVARYVKFKQGEVWQDLAAELAADGVVPTEPDAERIASGIQAVADLAAAVVSEQAALLGAAAADAATVEGAYYAAMAAQQIQEKEARVYKKSRASLTMRERQEAKTKKEAMLRNSIKGHAEIDPDVIYAPADPDSPREEEGAGSGEEEY